MRNKYCLLAASIAIILVSCLKSNAQFTIAIETHKDSSIFAAGFNEGIPGVVNQNMGSHSHVTVGKANNDRISRAVFGFVLNELISEQAMVTNVTFAFQVSQQGGINGSEPVEFSLHALNADWDEGTGVGNTGEPTGDGVTWDMRTAFESWANQGGDFGNALGDVFVDNVNLYSIQSDELTESVQQMLSGGQANFGFLMKAEPETISGSASRVSSREAGGDMPATLIIEFDLNPLLGDVNFDGEVDLLDVTVFVNRVLNSTFQPEADCNQDGEVNLLDVGPFVDFLVG